MKLNEVAATPKKAGFIPYAREGDKLLFMFMKSSDASFGGNAPMIAKGNIDPGETPKEAAIREAEEELGLVRANLKTATVKEVWRGELTGQTESYVMVIYAGEVKDKNNFTKPHYETESVHWMTNKEFQSKGKTLQRQIVSQAYSKIAS